ncbi:MAG: alcohol dehydrogenase [Bacillus thermozeamaize]|jgi:NADPH:quinone reductase-like Zn-dependent oxidoreductase|uniref:Alcohol dehydrogenase n=1 Tax=Bacillus thermozeamaize TaxID=230954 RepID=A0A1Y3PX45_9BACI|nr:MAG: alcohol dehydrogenase [Bacillus thermozeamaize]
MKAIVLREPEGPKNLRYEEVEIPKPKADEVLIKLHYAALNRRDVFISYGRYPRTKLPSILGSDGAGEVVARGENVKNVEEGSRVVINPGLAWGDQEAHPGPNFHILGMPVDGTFAEYVVVPAAQVYPKPEHLTWEEAAALPLAGVTAYRAVVTRGQVQAGETVLISGIGSGVALYALQMALAKGANVYVTSGSDEKIERAIRLGAAGGVNYRKEGWVKRLREMIGGADLIVDGVAGPGFTQLIEVTNPGGRIVSYGATNGSVPELIMRGVFSRQMDIRGTTMGSPRDFANMLELYAKHQLRPVIDRRYPLEEAAEAMLRMEQGLNFGKITLKIVDS